MRIVVKHIVSLLQEQCILNIVASEIFAGIDMKSVSLGRIKVS